MNDQQAYTPDPLLALIAELERYLQAPAVPSDARFASVRWEIIRRTAGHLANCSHGPATGARHASDLDPSFEADWRTFVESWSGAQVFQNWLAFKDVARSILKRLRRHLAGRHV